jgi:hypothetical protein
MFFEKLHSRKVFLGKIGLLKINFKSFPIEMETIYTPKIKPKTGRIVTVQSICKNKFEYSGKKEDRSDLSSDHKAKG